MNPRKQMAPSSADLRGDADAAAAEAELAWAIDRGQAEQVMRRTAARVRQRRLRSFAAGLSVICVAVFGWFAWSGHSAREVRTPVAATPVVSSVETRTLADGSVAELSRGAQMVVEFSATRRSVTLVRGNAHFEVAKDPARPFVVTAGDVEARAVGTAFAVQLGGSTVEVLVTHGTVEVDRADQAAMRVLAPEAKPAEVVLTAGKRVVIDLAASDRAPLVVETVTGAEASERLAWRIPLLEFSGTPLSDVVALFNRHGKPHLTFGDDSIRSLQLSGVLRADNTDLLLHLLKIEFGIQAERRAGEIVLRR